MTEEAVMAVSSPTLSVPASSIPLDLYDQFQFDSWYGKQGLLALQEQVSHALCLPGL